MIVFNNNQISVYFQLFLSVNFIFYEGYAQDFGYDGDMSPPYWGKVFRQCVGKHQSPIDIVMDNVVTVKYPPLVYENFNKKFDNVKIINNGHTAQITISNGPKPCVSGGPLRGRYCFVQMHFHWGTNDKEGSETQINHKRYPLELHMVFYRTKYGNFQKSMDHADGLAVLSFLYTANNSSNKNIAELIDGLHYVKKFNSSIAVKNFPSLDKFSTTKRNVYFTYEGSLTTPPCSEVVTWIEFEETIFLSHEQLESFRRLREHNGANLTHNFRPVQPLHGRVIHMSYSRPRHKNSSNSLASSNVILVIIYAFYQTYFLLSDFI